MKKNINHIAALAFAVTVASGETIQIRLSDDNAVPLAGAEVRVIFGGTLTNGSRDHAVRFQTDARGYGRASGRAEYNTTVFVTKAGYYDLRLDRIRAGSDHDLALVMRPQRGPRSLYVRDFVATSSTTNTKFPRHGEWVGFDLEVSDWVVPHGRGKIADIQFRFRNEFMGWGPNPTKMLELRQIHHTTAEDQIRRFYGKWDAELDISFPGAKEGLFEETRFLPYSRMKLPHEAPVEGYVSTWRYTVQSYVPRTARSDIGFFLRTRVKLDEKGNIVSAHYAKIIGDFRADPTGSLSFFYYFNPVPNDRNLEFDPKKNLFPEDALKGTSIGDP